MVQNWLNRVLAETLRKHLERGKSVLLLGPRQTGKTSLLQRFDVDLSIDFLLSETRQRYEKNPDRLLQAVKALPKHGSRPPLVLIDEVQKVPEIMDTVQFAVDKGLGQFVLTGSSARKLRRRKAVNFLPGRVVMLRLDPLSLSEVVPETIDELLCYGSLPGILTESDLAFREQDLQSYVTLFLEEEVRKEALVRNVPAFARFLELAAIDAGGIANFSEISQQIGVAHNTVASHYEILEDCLVAERIEPISKSATRRRLTKSPRFLFFDLGVRRLAAGEGIKPPAKVLGHWFEQWVGLELLRWIRLMGRPGHHLRYWRDPNGPEVDWVVETPDALIPIEVKWSTSPTQRDARHLNVFLDEYPKAKKALVVSRTDVALQLSEHVTAIPWQALLSQIEGLSFPVADSSV